MKKRILVIEDNEQNLYLCCFLLEQHGYGVSVARNGIEAFEQAHSIVPDLMLMDIQMPEMDGYEAIQRLKSDPKTRDIPIIAVSSYAMTGDRDKALNLGCACYIEKPIVPETFVARIREYL